MRRLYAYVKNDMKPYHHIYVNSEIKKDLLLWLKSLKHPTAYARPFMDFSKYLVASEIQFYTDASKNMHLGWGGWCNDSFYYQQWDSNFIVKKDPSIEYLELYAVTVGLELWLANFANQRIIILCDNESVCKMLNKTTSSCKNCMILMSRIVLLPMTTNTRVFARHIGTKLNKLADDLSRMKLNSFNKLFQGKDKYPTPIPDELWPMEKVWMDEN